MYLHVHYLCSCIDKHSYVVVISSIWLLVTYMYCVKFQWSYIAQCMLARCNPHERFSLSIGCRYQGVCSSRVDIASPIPCSLSYGVVTRDSTVRHAAGRRSFWDGRSNCGWLPQFSRPAFIRWIIHAHYHAHTCTCISISDQVLAFCTCITFWVSDTAHLLLSFSSFSL